MKTFILILVMIGGQGDFVTLEFSSKVKCQEAVLAIEKEIDAHIRYTTLMTCVEK